MEFSETSFREEDYTNELESSKENETQIEENIQKPVQDFAKDSQTLISPMYNEGEKSKEQQVQYTLPESYHINTGKQKDFDQKEIVNKAIKDGDFFTVFNNLDKLKDINHQEIANKVIENGGAYEVFENLDKLKDINYQKIVNKAIKGGDFSTVFNNLDKLKDVNYQKIANKAIENKEFSTVLNNLDKLKDVNHQKIANKAIENGQACKVFNNLDKLKDVDHGYIVDKALENKEFGAVICNLDKLKNIDQKGIVDKAVENKDFGAVIYNLDKLKDIDHQEIVNKALENKDFSTVFNNLDKLKDIDHQEIVNKAIENRRTFCIFGSLGKLKDVDYQEIANKAIENGETYEVFNNLDKLKDVNHQEIANKAIENGQAYKVFDNLDKLKDIDHQEIANKAIENHKAYIIFNNLDKLKDVNHQEIANKVIENGQAYMIFNNLDELKDVNHQEIASKAIENGQAYKVFGDLDKLKGVNHKDIVNKAIEYGEIDSIAQNLHKISSSVSLPNSIAISFANRGYIKEIVQNFNKFRDLDNDTAIALAKGGQEYYVLQNREKFKNFNNDDWAKILEDELRIFGITEGGEKGLNELLGFAKDLEASFHFCNINEAQLNILANSEMALQMLLDISGFDKGSWGARNAESLKQKVLTTLKSKKNGTESYLHSDYIQSNIYEIPKIRADIEFTEDVQSKYSTLRNDIFGALDAVKTEGGISTLVKEIRTEINKIYKETETLIANIDYENDPKASFKKANLEKQKNSLTRYLETNISSDKDTNVTLSETEPTFILNSPNAFTQGLMDLGQHDKLFSPIRKLLYAGAFRRYPEQMDVMSQLSSEPTFESVSSMTEFLSHIVSKESYGDYFYGNRKLSKMFGKISNTEALDEAISKITKDIDESGISEKLQFIPTRGLLLEMSGQIASACWAYEYDSVGETMPNMSAVIMRANPGTDNDRHIGAALLIETTSPTTGEKVLLLRGTNPREEYINGIDTSAFYDAITDYVKVIANRRGMIPAIVIDSYVGGSSTNRPALFSTVSEKVRDLTPIYVDDATTNFNGYDVTDVSYRLD